LEVERPKAFDLFLLGRIEKSNAIISSKSFNNG